MSLRRFVLADRGLSPVIGGVLLIAVVVALGALTGAMVLNLVDTTDPAPSAAFEVENAPGSAVEIRVTDGDSIDAERLSVRGAETAGALDSAGTLTAGDTFVVYPTDDDLELVWQSAESDQSYRLASLEAPETGGLVEAGVAWDGTFEGRQVSDGRNGPEEYYSGVSFEVTNADDEARELVEVRIDAASGSDIGAVYSTSSSRPSTCSGPAEETAYCPLVLVDPTSGTPGMTTENEPGADPTTGYAAGGADIGFDAATLDAGTTAEVTIYRFQRVGGSATLPFGVAHVPGEELTVTLVFDDGRTFEATAEVAGPDEPSGFTVDDPVALSDGDAPFEEFGDIEVPGLRSRSGHIDVDAESGHEVLVDGDMRSDTSTIALEAEGSGGNSPITVTGDVRADGDVGVEPDESSIDVGGNIRSESGAVDLETNEKLNGTLSVGGDIDANSSVTIDGDDGAVDVGGAVTSETSSVSLQADNAPVTVGEGIAADGSISLDADNDTFDVGGDVVGNSSLSVQGDDGTVTIDGTVEIDGDIDFDQSVTVTGDVISNNGNIDLSSATHVEGDVIAENGTVSENGATVEGNVEEG